MKRFIILMVMLIVLGFTMMVQGQKESGAWEYANIQYDAFGVWFWKDATLYAEGKEITDLCRELSIIASGNENQDLFTIVDWAGRHGWELVTVNQRVSYTSVWFKRKN